MNAGPHPVGVVGLGLIGGGVALDLHHAGLPVLGYDLDPEVRSRAGELGLTTVDDLAELAAGSALVVVAVPLGAVGATCRAVRDASGVLVTDVASVKDRAALGIRGLDRFLGGHPMAGNERSGIDAARPGLFDGAVWFLTPDADTTVDDLAAVLRLVLSLSAHPVLVDVATHDAYVAMLSHVPHLLAYGLHASASALVGDGLHGFGGGSFRDATRVAASAPGFWSEVLHANRGAVRAALARLDAWLADGAEELDDPSVLERRLALARRTPGTRPADAPRAVTLPTGGDRLGAETARELHRLGAAGFRVSGLEREGDGVTLRLEAL